MDRLIATNLAALLVGNPAFAEALGAQAQACGRAITDPWRSDTGTDEDILRSGVKSLLKAHPEFTPFDASLEDFLKEQKLEPASFIEEAAAIDELADGAGQAKNLLVGVLPPDLVNTWLNRMSEDLMIDRSTGSVLEAACKARISRALTGSDRLFLLWRGVQTSLKERPQECPHMLKSSVDECFSAQILIGAHRYRGDIDVFGWDTLDYSIEEIRRKEIEPKVPDLIEK